MITPHDFAKRHFGEHKQMGDELKPMYCPYCKGGQSHDKYTFALNAEKLTYNCLRGSCAVAGTFNQLCKDFGEEAEARKTYEIKPPPKIKYKTPQTKPQEAGSKVEQYLIKRGFSKGTWTCRGVSEHEGNICFPYYEKMQPVLMKFRKPEKYEGKGQKAWREEGGKAVFWGMDDCSPDKPLVIVEGEFDALALDEAGIPNVVSVPSGAEDLTCVDNCWDWLQEFKRVIIWPDNDEPGQGMCRKLITRLGAWRCYVVATEHKDANEALHYVGKDGVRKIFLEAKEVPISGLIRLADVKAFDYEKIVRVKSSIRSVNEITGGYMMGQVSIWTGINSSGKSTFLGQELLETIDQGFSVCAYSGELPGAMFRYWVDLQACGPGNLVAQYDSFRGEEVLKPNPEKVKLIREWYRDKFFLFDSFGNTKDDELLKVFEYAAMRYGCKIFLIDNLMTTAFEGGERDYYRKQSEFVGRVKDFAHTQDVHVHLVAHPRKTNGRLTKMDVAGTGDITNRADNVFSVHRFNPTEKEEGGFDAVLDIFKSRFSGRQDEEIFLLFNAPAKRFYMRSEPLEGKKQYGWISYRQGDGNQC